jgi:DNA-binding HxlR family transcriptional regulator
MDLDRFLRMVSDPHRKAIIQVLMPGPLAYTELMRRMGLDTKTHCGTVNYHLREMERRGIVVRLRKGPYSLTSLGRDCGYLLRQLEQKNEEWLGRRVQ